MALPSNLVKALKKSAEFLVAKLSDDINNTGK
jgi:hypothetical protein